MYTFGTLLERYALSKTQMYKRLNHLEIKLAKLDDGRSFATEEEVARLDRLHDWLEEGDRKRFMREYTEPQEVEVMPEVSIVTEEEFTTQGNLFVHAANTIIKKIQEFHVSSIDEAIAGLRALEEVAANKWLINTAQVQKMIGVKPSGAVFVRGSFTFIRQGKIGGQASWLVVKSKVNLIGINEYT
jgi:hypothetical protein